MRTIKRSLPPRSKDIVIFFKRCAYCPNPPNSWPTFIMARGDNSSLSLRLATKTDLDGIVRVVQAAYPDDPDCTYKYPHHREYPDDFMKWTRVEYESYMGQPEKYAVLVVTASINDSEGRMISNEPIALAVWDIAVEMKSRSGGSERFHIAKGLICPSK